MSDRQHRRGARTSRRLIGAVSSVGAFLALGMSPLAAAPAQADFDWLDPFGLFDAGVETGVPGAADFSDIDWGGLFVGDSEAWTNFDDIVFQSIYNPMQEMLGDDDFVAMLAPLNDMFATADSCGVICNGSDAYLNDDGDLVAAQNGGAWFGDGGNGLDGSDGGAAASSATEVPVATRPRV